MMQDRMKTGYRYNVVDIHSHILPGVDDGAGDVSESMRLLRAAAEQGIRDIIATPHYGMENGYAPSADRVRAAFEEVRAALENGREDLNRIRLYLGEEVYCAGDASSGRTRKNCWGSENVISELGGLVKTENG